jgi:flagellar hook assembly protein FlgD
LNVFNYPNPFKNDTYFTFELHGIQTPEELKIKVFTVAGRLIKEFSVPLSDLKIGFNKIYWNGRDQDGDEVANGVYFYKIIAKNNGVVKTTTEKLAKIK